MRTWIKWFRKKPASVQWTISGTLLTVAGLVIGIVGLIPLFSSGDIEPPIQPVSQHLSGGNDNVQIGSVRDGGTVVVSSKRPDPYEQLDSARLVDNALALYKGKGETRNLAEAARNLDEAVKRGDSRALTIKGDWLLDGVAYRKDHKDALRLWEQAAHQEYPQAAFNLGEYHFQLRGGERWREGPLYLQYGLHHAIHWYLLAAKSGHGNAGKRLRQNWSADTLGMLKEEYPGDILELQSFLSIDSK